MDRDNEYVVSAAAPATSAIVSEPNWRDARARNSVWGMRACRNEAHGDNRLSPT